MDFSKEAFGVARLQDIKAGCRVRGLRGDKVVTIISAEMHGGALTVYYRDDGNVTGDRVVFPDDAGRVEVLDSSSPLWDFGANGKDLKLVSEAYRIHLAHVFDPYLAVHTSSVEPLPHQISAVYQEMLPRRPLRFLLADDPGAGKTIMTGLLLRELIARGDLVRCLIVAPGSLVEQWQAEMHDKFHLNFKILTDELVNASISGNPFLDSTNNFCIARIDKLKKDEPLQNWLAMLDWDLIVVDEAHKMSATYRSGRVNYTKRYRLGELLSDITRNFLLLTATPHNGNNDDFMLFMSLIDPDRFAGVEHNENKHVDASGAMRRIVKEEMLKFDGSPLFPERCSYTVDYKLSDPEHELYEAVTEYVRNEFNLADRLDGKHRNAVGFALTVLQRRLASSPEAIYQSLKRRCERLEERLDDIRHGRRIDDYIDNLPDDDDDDDDLTEEERGEMEDDIAGHASAAKSQKELAAEIETLHGLKEMAERLRASGRDRKWEELSELLDDDKIFGKDKDEKLIIFTEHKDTLNYLRDKIITRLGRPEAVVTISGGMRREDRRMAEDKFRQDKDVVVMVATDAAGEGINLQRAHLMINYDLPWNPNRLEQRFGRIHRIGQKEVCHLWNLIAGETREGQVFKRLFKKLEEEKASLGGKVFDILGKVTFDNKSLRELLVEAIRRGDDQDGREDVAQIMDHSLEHEKLKALIEEKSLDATTMDTTAVRKVCKDMLRAEARKLQPYYIRQFFEEAFESAGGRIVRREHNRCEVRRVPEELITFSKTRGYNRQLLGKYERVCFDKRNCVIEDTPECADLICPGHPLMDAVVDYTLDKYADVLKHGAVLVDEQDYGTEPRLLFYAELSASDSLTGRDGKENIIARDLRFIELKEDGTAREAGYAPYLDYRPLAPEEAPKAMEYIKSQEWLSNEAEERAKAYINDAKLLKPYKDEICNMRLPLLKKTKDIVRKRLQDEIAYWDKRTQQLKEDERKGKPNKHITSAKARERADRLQTRLTDRLEKIGLEMDISLKSPVINGVALVLPFGLLNKIMGNPKDFSAEEAERKTSERIAMDTVMKIERSLGYTPADVSAQKCGYDIESSAAQHRDWLRMIEVKGRQRGATTVTVTKNEIMAAFNCRDMKQAPYILAIVEIDGEHTHTTYLRNPFTVEPDSASESTSYDIKRLMRKSEKIEEYEG